MLHRLYSELCIICSRVIVTHIGWFFFVRPGIASQNLNGFTINEQIALGVQNRQEPICTIRVQWGLVCWWCSLPWRPDRVEVVNVYVCHQLRLWPYCHSLPHVIAEFPCYCRVYRHCKLCCFRASCSPLRKHGRHSAFCTITVDMVRSWQQGISCIMVYPSGTILLQLAITWSEQGFWGRGDGTISTWLMYCSPLVSSRKDLYL